jgi:D-arabinose 1-dehydrogenase-like Zn-dependent alcohol dehydrogenase
MAFIVNIGLRWALAAEQAAAAEQAVLVVVAKDMMARQQAERLAWVVVLVLRVEQMLEQAELAALEATVVLVVDMVPQEMPVPQATQALQEMPETMVLALLGLVVELGPEAERLDTIFGERAVIIVLSIIMGPLQDYWLNNEKQSWTLTSLNT